MHYPEKKGYSARNLAYMCQFARTFSVEVLQKMLSCDVKLKKPTIDNVQSATRKMCIRDRRRADGCVIQRGLQYHRRGGDAGLAE